MTHGDTPPSGNTSHRNEATPPALAPPATLPLPLARPANIDAHSEDCNAAVVARARVVANTDVQGTKAYAGTRHNVAAVAAARAIEDTIFPLQTLAKQKCDQSKVWSVWY